ncbi:DASH complex subunit Dad1-domain-containing protein [Xylariaceae sp. FL1651]|nr:DASH complex subunit Dad1-domain-containing protein [Xylariaceae sp. FL1651]
MAANSRSASVMGGSTGAGGPTTGGSGGGTREKTYFEQQREALIGEIAMNFEHVLANINKLNRSLEAVVAVGNEFSSVEALWSQFENVMAKDGEEGKVATGSGEGEEQDHQEGPEISTTPKGEPRRRDFDTSKR